MFPISSIFLGIARLSCTLILFFYLNRKYVNKSTSLTFTHFFIFNWLKYSSVILLMVFTLEMVDSYNLFNCILLLCIIIAAEYWNSKHQGKIVEEVIINLKNSLIYTLKKIENKKISVIKFLTDAKGNFNSYNSGVVALTLCLTTFFSRIFLISYDKNTFSETWLKDFCKMSNIDLQIWFSDDYSLTGELAILNFYSKLTDVSPEVANQSIGILEAILLAIIIFWTIDKVVTSKFLIPIIISPFIFSLVYVLSPLNVHYFLEKTSLFFALSLAIPILMFFFKPPIQHITFSRFCGICFLAFVAIGLTDLFTFLIIIPPVIILSIFFTKKKYISICLSATLLYLLSISVILHIYSIYCYYSNIDLIEYFHNNLFSVNSTGYNLQLVLPYERILFYLECYIYLGLVLLLILLLNKKTNLRFYFSTFIYFIFLIILTNTKNDWIDKELIFKSFAVFVPITIGLHLAVIYQIIYNSFQKVIKYPILNSFLLIFIFIFLSIFLQQKKMQTIEICDQTPLLIFSAYDKITQDFLPFTYSVVNDSRSQMISLQKHYFMNYSYFINEYLYLDNIYFIHRNKANFLKKNPEFALPNSVLVFVLMKQKMMSSDTLSLGETSSISLKKDLAILKRRGRRIDLYYELKNLKVYEIVNEPSKSKISDLIFAI